MEENIIDFIIQHTINGYETHQINGRKSVRFDFQGENEVYSFYLQFDGKKVKIYAIERSPRLMELRIDNLLSFNIDQKVVRFIHLLLVQIMLNNYTFTMTGA